MSSRKYPFEIPGFSAPVGSITITVKWDKNMLNVVSALGIEGEALKNYEITLLDECRDALDGSVRGLVVSNLEE